MVKGDVRVAIANKDIKYFDIDEVLTWEPKNVIKMSLDTYFEVDGVVMSMNSKQYNEIFNTNGKT